MNRFFVNLYLIFFSLIFCQIDLNPRMLGVSGASTTIASGYNSIGVNPANLATNKSLSMNLFSINGFIVNDFLSVKTYNDINGADFENSASASYYSKSDLLDGIKGDDINIQFGMTSPFPIFSFAYKNFGLSLKNNTYMNFDLPKSIIDIMLNGNIKDKRFLLGLSGNAISANEIGISYAHGFDIDGIAVQVGITFKYLQGLAYLQMNDIENNGSYILTEQTYFHGSGKYLIEQAFGGSGTSTDLGVLLPEFSGGWNLGFSIINLGADIEWGSENFTKGFLGDAIEGAIGLRQNEHYYLSFLINDMNISSYFDSEEDLITSDFYQVGIFSDLPLKEDITTEAPIGYEIDFDGDSILWVNTSYIDSSLIIDLGEGSYLVPSENLLSDQLQSQSSKNIHFDYPSSLRIGVSKQIQEYGLISLDLVTGFDDSFGNSNKFRFSFGTEIIRISTKFPIRFGFSLGGNQPNSYSLGFGYNGKPFSIDFGRKYYHGIIRNRAMGAEYAFSISINTTDFSFKDVFKLKLPKFKLPKLPKLPKAKS